MASVYSVNEASNSNPLLLDFDFPPFHSVTADHIRPAIRALLKDLKSQLDELEATVEPSWLKLVVPLEKIVDKLSVVWGMINHLRGVKDSSELRSAIEEVQPEKVEFELRLGQSKLIYNAFKSIRESPNWQQMSNSRKRVVEYQIKEAVLNGVSLEDDKREEFNKIQQELEKLSQKFGENVFDATKKFEKFITDKKDVEGLPSTALQLAAETAVSKGHEKATAENGPWMITLDAPSYRNVMRDAINRDLREEVYRAYITRASSGDMDNTRLINQILKLKLEKAKLLGYNNFAEMSMSRKMATIDKAHELLEKLRVASWDRALQDVNDLRSFAKEQGAVEADDLALWDITFWSQRLLESKYDISEEADGLAVWDFTRLSETLKESNCDINEVSSFNEEGQEADDLGLSYTTFWSDCESKYGTDEEEVDSYFSLPKVMDGLFGLAKKLFGVDVEPADGLAPVWNSDVKFYRVKDSSSGSPIAYFYFDPYSRPSEKKEGAWVDEAVSRSYVCSRDGTSVRLPIAYMVCNQTPPVGSKPSLMTFREVEAVFHEFGHALQHMLTKQDEGLVAGYRGIERDALELPSQFMENWCYHRGTIMSIAKHYETGESLPEEVYQKILAARTYFGGYCSLQELRFAILDLELHSTYIPEESESIYDVDQRVSLKTSVIPPLAEDRFLCSFLHIFEGGYGYAAGYYSYKWAEVLSADAFSAFEDVGLDNDEAVRETGQRFRETVLALGGGMAPLEVFVEFRGREPSPEPLLRHNGLLPAVA